MVNFKEKLQELEDRILDYDPTSLLSSLFLSKYAINKAKNYNPETFPSTAYLEILQALILRHQPDEFRNRSDNFDDVYSSLHELFSLYCFKDIDNNNCAPMIASIKMQKLLVRGDMYPFQIKNQIQGIWKRIKTQKDLGFEVSEIAQTIINRIIEEVEARLYQIHGNPKIQDVRKRNKDTIIEKYSQEDLNIILEFNNKLKECFFFTIEDLIVLFSSLNKEHVVFIFDRLSLEFGDTKEKNCEHLFLDNPVCYRPFIKLDESNYFIGIPTLLNMNGIKILEEIIKGKDKLHTKYRQDARAEFLEDSIANLMKMSFYNAQCLMGSKYQATDDKDGKLKGFENDLTIIWGNWAIIIEAKASRFKDSVSRGSEVTLNEAYKENILYASEQANRFEQFITENRSKKKITTAEGYIDVDFSKINKILKYNIILDNMPYDVLSCKSVVEYAEDKSLSYAPNPTITLSDLEIILDVLEKPLLILDYLNKRYRLDLTDYLPKTNGDEMDFLGLYLSTGFNIKIDDDIDLISVSGYSYDMGIDSYYELKDTKIKISKPIMNFNHKFNFVINKILSKKNYKFIDCCLNLLSIPFAGKNMPSLSFNQGNLLYEINEKIKVTKKKKKLSLFYIKEIGSVFVFHHGYSQEQIRAFIDNAEKIDKSNENIFVITFDTKSIYSPFSEAFLL